MGEYINENEKFVPSFTDVFKQSKASMNSVSSWMELEVEPAEVETPVGCSSSDKRNEELSSGKFLYPTYINYCKRNSIKPIEFFKFSSNVITAASSCGWYVEKGRKKYGVYIYGIAIKDIVTDI